MELYWCARSQVRILYIANLCSLNNYGCMNNTNPQIKQIDDNKSTALKDRKQ